MARRVLAFMLLVMVAACIPSSVYSKPVARQDPCAVRHGEWVRDVLTKMQTIKPGMTRAELLEVFRAEGGLSTGVKRRFISRDCPYFKVDVVFEAVGRPGRDGDGRATVEEDPRDIIAEISRPYVQFAVAD